MADAKAASANEKIKRDGNAAAQKGKPKHRSPNYPAIGLRKSVERLDELYKEFKRHNVPIGVAQKKWDYKEHSGAANQVVAAIKAFGLLDVIGDGDNRQLRISDVGWRIVENHKDRTALLKAAAVAPTLHAELWERYGNDGLPPDDVIRHHLKFDRNFNPESVDSFISQFRDTIGFANLNSSDKVPEVDSGDVEQDADMDVPQELPSEGNGQPLSLKKYLAKGASQDTFTLDEGPVTLVYPANLSEHSLEDFKDWIQLAVRKIERSIKRKTEPPQED